MNIGSVSLSGTNALSAVMFDKFNYHNHILSWVEFNRCHVCKQRPVVQSELAYQDNFRSNFGMFKLKFKHHKIVVV